MSITPTAPASAPTLELREIAKAFGAVIALSNGSLQLHANSIHALVGENGAGKSTLIKILSGAVLPDAGEVMLQHTRLPLGDLIKIVTDHLTQWIHHPETRDDITLVLARKRPAAG